MMCDIKQLLGSVFVICRIATVEVRFITRVEGETDNSYRDFDNFAFYTNNCFIIRRLKKIL